jgi:radical SAM protein with 4Fe4S-binding SPASM domain
MEDNEHLVYVRLIEACNMRCQHCFIPPNPKNMSDNVLFGIEEILKDKIPKGSIVNIRFHGGEPTLIGPKKFIEVIESLKSSNYYTYTFGIQTNLLTFSDEWAEIYKKYFDEDVGISWDYKIRLLKENDLASNDKFEEIFWNNIKDFISNDLNPYLVITGTKTFFEHFSKGFKFFEFLQKHNIKTAHIEKLTRNGYAAKNWATIGVDNAEYSKFMTSLYSKYLMWNKNSDYKINLSPFDGLMTSVRDLKNGKEKGYGCWSGVCDTRFHTIDANGYKLGCTAINSEEDNSNSVTNGLQILNIMDISSKRDIRKIDCSVCDFKKICSTGCLASEKSDGSGECSGHKKLFELIYSNDSFS